MTREEAISLLSQVNHILVNSNSWLENTHEPLNIAFDMAIKALEQEPCEDAISREKAKEEAWSLCLETGFNNEKVVEMLDDLPSVTPTRKKGKWIGHGEHCENLGVIPSGLGAYEWCSNCDCGIDVREWHRNHYNYCPNCGADMREVEE